MNTLSLKKIVILTALTIGIWCGSTSYARELNSTTIIPFCPTSSTTCTMTNIGITSIASGTFFSYSNLQRLSLNSNQITSIENGDFYGLSNLTYLNLKENCINTTDTAYQTYINSLLIPNLYDSSQNVCSIPVTNCPTCRTVTCQDQFGNIVADSFCDATTMPSTVQTQMCSVTNSYSWSQIRGTCTYLQTCEPIGQNPNFSQTETCQALNTTSCVSPANIMTCQIMPSTNGTQSTDNICKDPNGNVGADSLCPQPEPTPQTQACGSITTS